MYFGRFVPFVMKMEITGLSTVLVFIYQATRRHIPKDRTIEIQFPENLNSHEFIYPL
jgi:hypothetical protein